MKIPDIGAERVVEDPVHGSIPTTGTEHALIQLPLFTRLHRVRQNSTAHLTFPGALTSRFGHVLGSMFIGSKIAAQVLRKMRRDDFDVLFPTLDARVDAELLIKAVRLACLFHDAGHGPFSHASEGVMASVISGEEKAEARSLLGENPPIHEYFSYKLMQTDGVRAVLEPRLAEAAASLVADKPPFKIARDNEAGFAAFRKMVSGQTDADRADYLARDALMSGMPYGRIDYDRIMLNMAVVPDTQGRYELAIHHRALGAVEHMLGARFYMYRLLYRHHKVIATDDLAARSIERMISDGVLDRNWFHWTSFERGLGIDDYIVGRMADKWSRGHDGYENYRGLWDRRYLPVSLLKRPADYLEFARRAREFTKRDMGDDTIVGKIMEFQALPDANKIMRAALSSLGEPWQGAYMMIKFGGGAPYRPPVSPDSIWLYTSDGGMRLRELTGQSARASSINEEWMGYPSVYFSCIVPGLKRGEVTPAMKKELTDAAVQAIFS